MYVPINFSIAMYRCIQLLIGVKTVSREILYIVIYQWAIISQETSLIHPCAGQ